MKIRIEHITNPYIKRYYANRWYSYGSHMNGSKGLKGRFISFKVFSMLITIVYGLKAIK